jgi:hypothetical protein
MDLPGLLTSLESELLLTERNVGGLCLSLD